MLLCNSAARSRSRFFVTVAPFIDFSRGRHPIPEGWESGAVGADPNERGNSPSPPAMSTSSAKVFQSAGLSQARHILCEEGTYLICLHTDDLWDAYSLKDHLLTMVKERLIEAHWLSRGSKWGGVNGGQFTVLDESGNEAKRFMSFSRLFNVVLEFLRQAGHTPPVERMVHIGSVKHESTRVSGYHPDAFLQLAGGTAPTPGKLRWRDLVCPFEYMLDDDNVSGPGSIAC